MPVPVEDNGGQTDRPPLRPVVTTTPAPAVTSAPATTPAPAASSGGGGTVAAGGNAPGALQWAGWAAEYSAETGVPADIFLALIQAESGGNQYIVGDAGASVGLFQLHERGVGYGLTVEERQNPQVQFDLMAPRIANAYQQAIAEGIQNSRDLVARVGVLAERPADQTGAAYARAYDRLYEYWTGNQTTVPVVDTGGSGPWNAGNVVVSGGAGYSAPFDNLTPATTGSGIGGAIAGGVGGAALGSLAGLLGSLATLLGASRPDSQDDSLTLFRIGNFPINVSKSGWESGLANTGAIVIGLLLLIGAIVWLGRKAGAGAIGEAVKEIVAGATK